MIVSSVKSSSASIRSTLTLPTKAWHAPCHFGMDHPLTTTTRPPKGEIMDVVENTLKKVMWLTRTEVITNRGLFMDVASSCQSRTPLRCEWRGFSRITSTEAISAWHPLPRFPYFLDSDPIAPTLFAEQSFNRAGFGRFDVTHGFRESCISLGVII